MDDKGQPTWQPISAQLEDGRDQHRLLSQARPYVLDDATVERLLRVYGETAEDLWLYDQQLGRWGRLALTPAQRREVERVQSQMTALREVVERILTLGARLKDQTIESLLAKSDLEIGIEGLLGRRDG